MILPQNIVFSKHQNKVELKNLDDSEVLCGNFPGPRTSASSLTSFTFATSMASTGSRALFHQKNFLILILFFIQNKDWDKNDVILGPLYGY